MTWNELNDKTGDMLPDALGPGWDELLDSDMEDDEVYNCQALEMVIETMQQITADKDCPEDYTELIRELPSTVPGIWDEFSQYEINQMIA